MMLSLSVSLIWLLALLAAGAHVQLGRKSAAALGGMMVVFAAVLMVGVWLSPQPNWIGVLVGLTAMWQLIGGPFDRAGNFLGAVCAALAAALQISGGVPVWLAAPLAAAALLAAAFALNGRPVGGGFRDIVLIGTALAAPVIGLAGDIVYGWQSAGALNRSETAMPDVSMPVWTISIVALALLGGVLRGIWKKQ